MYCSLKKMGTLKKKRFSGHGHQALTDGILPQRQVFNNTSSLGLTGAVGFHPGLCFLCQDYTLRKDRKHFLPCSFQSTTRLRRKALLGLVGESPGKTPF